MVDLLSYMALAEARTSAGRAQTRSRTSGPPSKSMKCFVSCVRKCAISQCNCAKIRTYLDPSLKTLVCKYKDMGKSLGRCASSFFTERLEVDVLTM